MNTQELINISKTQPIGSYINIVYSTTPELNAASKKAGVVVSKKVTKTVRLGCNYSNMKAVIAAKEAGRGTREMYEEPIVANLIYRNIKNGQEYLRIGNVPNSHESIEYSVDGVTCSLDDVAKYLIPSALKAKDAPEVQNIKVENVMSLGKEVRI